MSARSTPYQTTGEILPRNQIIIDISTPKELLERDTADRDETFIAVFNDEAVGEPTAEVDQLYDIKADDDNLEEAID